MSLFLCRAAFASRAVTRLAGGRVVFVSAHGEVLAEVNGKQFAIAATLLATDLTESDGFECRREQPGLASCSVPQPNRITSW